MYVYLCRDFLKKKSPEYKKISCVNKQTNCYTFSNQHSKWGGGVQSPKIWVGTRRRAFKNRVSGTDFFWLKLGSPEQIFAKTCVSGAKTGLEMQDFFKKIKVGSPERGLAGTSMYDFGESNPTGVYEWCVVIKDYYTIRIM